MVGKAVELIPAGDCGEFRITDQMMREVEAATMEAFTDLLIKEARRRGLTVQWWRSYPDHALIVRWRPSVSDTPELMPGI